MNVIDANVMIGFLDASNANHAQAVTTLQELEGERLAMHEVTIAEVLAGPAQFDRASAESVWASILQLGVVQITPDATALDVALLRASTGLPIPDCLVILSAGEATDGNRVVTFDERLATKARELGYTVMP